MLSCTKKHLKQTDYFKSKLTPIGLLFPQEICLPIDLKKQVELRVLIAFYGKQDKAVQKIIQQKRKNLHA